MCVCVRVCALGFVMKKVMQKVRAEKSVRLTLH